MKNMMLAFGLGLAFLFAGCGTDESGSYIETVEEAEAYEAELKVWAESIKELSGEAYNEEVITKLCDCANKINFFGEKKTDTAADSVRLVTISKMSLLGVKLLFSDFRDGSSHSDVQMGQIEEGANLKCPDTSNRLVEFATKMLSN